MMTDAPHAAGRLREPVSVVMPFAGDESQARAALERLGRIELLEGDELIVADNTPRGVFGALETGDVRVVRATGESSSYHARNVGAEAARNRWLLFVDADCEPRPDILDAYLRAPVPAEVGMLAGAIEPAAGQPGLLPEWAVTREILSQERSVAGAPPAAATANLMVRAATWREVGGFFEGIRSGGDFDFCWRAADAGWQLEYRPGAVVGHVHRESLRAIARQMARYAAGNAWQRRRRPGAPAPTSPLRALARATVAAPLLLLSLRPRRAALKVVDALAAACQLGGALLSNRVEPRRAGRADLVIATDRFPVPSETFIRSELEAIRALGREVRVEAVARPERPVLGAARGLGVRWLEDEGAIDRIAALAWALARHPLRCLRDRRFAARLDPAERLPLSAVAPMARRLARSGERHVHAHFAALASTIALRAGRIAGVPVSVAAHGHDVFATPRALPEKLAAAKFAAAPCEYTASHLRALAPGARVEVVVMGVDGERFRRRQPYPGGRVVAAVGRLVEKKGFADLIDAAAVLGPSVVERLVIAGDGPLRAELQARIDAAGAGEWIELAGALSSAEVRELLESADLLAMPCVIAADGDRDAMPVVVKEALAMELPVVATDEVGLPEVVHHEWGRLVPPRDPAAVADALRELLALPPAERAAMGAAGRAFVLARFDTASQARLLLQLAGL